MSDAETIANAFSDPEITSDSEKLSDGTIGDDKRPSRRRRAPCISFLPLSLESSVSYFEVIFEFCSCEMRIGCF